MENTIEKTKIILTIVKKAVENTGTQKEERRLGEFKAHRA